MLPACPSQAVRQAQLTAYRLCEEREAQGKIDRLRQQAQPQQRVQSRLELVSGGAQLLGAFFQQRANNRRRDEERRADEDAARAQEELRRLQDELAETRARIARQEERDQRANAELERAEAAARRATVAAEEAKMRARRRRVEGRAAQEEALRDNLANFAAPDREQSMIGWNPPAGLPTAAQAAADPWDNSSDADRLADEIGSSMRKLRDGMQNGIRSGVDALKGEFADRSLSEWVDDVVAMKDFADDLGDAGERGGLLGGIGRHVVNGVGAEIADRLKTAVAQRACGSAKSTMSESEKLESEFFGHACTAPFLMDGPRAEAPRRIWDFLTGHVDRGMGVIKSRFDEISAPFNLKGK